MNDPSFTENILVIVKTYPTVSKKWGATVCTAGINESGEWRRLYPVPWKIFSNKGGFRKWDIINVKIKKNPRDRRQESYLVTEPDNVSVIGHIDHGDKWIKRNKIIEELMVDSLESLKDTGLSLGVIKPTKNRFYQKERSCIDSENTISSRMVSIDSFGNNGIPVPENLPWIGFGFKCDSHDCKGHNMMCLDWEIQEQYRRLGYEKTAEKIEWMQDKRDLHLIMGSNYLSFRFKDLWHVIGVYYPPKRNESKLTDFI